MRGRGETEDNDLGCAPDSQWQIGPYQRMSDTSNQSYKEKTTLWIGIASAM
jgi:hypothetical protein